MFFTCRTFKPLLPVLFGLSLLPLHGEETEGPKERLLSIHLSPSEESHLMGKAPFADGDWSLEEDVPLEKKKKQAGWRAVSVPLSITAYVQRNYLGKDLSLSPESPVFLEPEATLENMLTVIEEQDEIEILELEKDWVKINLNKNLHGFARHSSWERDPDEQPAISEEEDSLVIDTIALEDARRDPPDPVRPEPRPGESFVGEMRHLEGVLATPRRFLGRGPDFDYEIRNQRGRRIALLDLDNLLITANLDRHLGRSVTVFGLLTETPDGDPYIIVESLRLR